MLYSPLTVTSVQEALNRPSLQGGFYNHPKSLALIERAVEVGVVMRISTTQAQWEDENSADELRGFISRWIEENEGDMPMVAYEGRQYQITYKRGIEIEADSLEAAKKEFENYSKTFLDAKSSFIETCGIEEI